jgi:hypothetical protein
MSISKRALSFTMAAAAAVVLIAPTSSHAQIGLLSPAVQQQMQAPNADVQAIAIAAAQADPALATAALQAAVTLLASNPTAAANAMKAFADLAAQLAAPGSGQNAALAAALTVAVENAISDPQNAALVNGEAAAIVASAKAEADQTLQNAEVQTAILAHAPGTEGSFQAALGDLGAGGTGPGGSNASPFSPPSSVVR